MEHTSRKTISATPYFFRLLDLPAELRHQVWSFALPTSSTPLASLKVPNLLQTNRQIRYEALPTFFAETEFTIPVGSDFQVRRRCQDHELGENLKYRSDARKISSKAGVLSLKPEVLQRLQNLGDDIVRFQKITFHVYTTGAIRNIQEGSLPGAGGYGFDPWCDDPDDYSPEKLAELLKLREEGLQVARMTIEIHGKGKVSTKIERGPSYPKFVPMVERRFYPEDVNAATTAVATEVRARVAKGYLTMTDVERIARHFRYGLWAA